MGALDGVSGRWPAVELDEARAFKPSGRVPAADRNVRYCPALPARVADRYPELSPETVGLVEEATLRLRTVDEAGATGPAAVPLLRSESAASSKIEHIAVGQRYVGRALAGLPTRQRSAREVAANVVALRTAVDAASDPIDAGTFDRVHAALLPDEPWAGAPRHEQNWIGGSDYSPRGARYVPPDPERVPGLLDDLAAFVCRDDVPALVQAGVAHAQFEVIHPYADGNGRVGRAIAHMVLRRRGVVVHGIAPISIAVLADQDTYLDQLPAYERGDVDGFTRWFARSALVAADAAERLRDQLVLLEQEWQELAEVAGSRRDATIRHIVVELAANPVVDAGGVAQRHGVSHEAARRALESLTDAGVLDRTTAARGLHVYEAHEVFAAIEDLERWVREERG